MNLTSYSQAALLNLMETGMVSETKYATWVSILFTEKVKLKPFLVLVKLHPRLVIMTSNRGSMASVEPAH